jgi:hypothetical protein
MGDTLEAIGDRLSPERMIERRRAAMGQRLHRIKDSVMGSPGYVEPISRRVSEGASGAAHAASGAVHSATDTVQQAPQLLADQTRGNPIAVGLVAFGAGALLATVMPTSRTEQRLIEEAKPELTGAAEELKGAAREVASDAKTRASEAVGEVKAAGGDASTRVQEQAKESSGSVRDAARNSE